ncbi:hypothetical protein E2562_036964 [Oryza meyeriana var. granulata]|uniref:Uncharacterized protein n=1 Tax=Oryza meyeriana var. granulata TaxID=110450 RepID=A0A6G1ETI4_9ORYZ|nr:hypothetical protein E2562_036964 [Oryza meyeriana var. granulata]
MVEHRRAAVAYEQPSWHSEHTSSSSTSNHFHFTLAPRSNSFFFLLLLLAPIAMSWTMHCDSDLPSLTNMRAQGRSSEADDEEPSPSPCTTNSATVNSSEPLLLLRVQPPQIHFTIPSPATRAPAVPAPTALPAVAGLRIWALHQRRQCPAEGGERGRRPDSGSGSEGGPVCRRENGVTVASAPRLSVGMSTTRNLIATDDAKVPTKNLQLAPSEVVSFVPAKQVLNTLSCSIASTYCSADSHTCICN